MSTEKPAFPEPGTPAPDFCLPADDGSEVCLKALRGKHVVLYFYPRDLTPGCTMEACAFRDLQVPMAAAGYVILGVSPDSVASHQRFVEKKNLNFRLLSDPDHRVMEAYGAWGKTKLLGVGYTGVIRSTVLIDPDGRIKKVYPKVKAKSHPAALWAEVEGEGGC